MQKSQKILMPNTITQCCDPFAISVYGILQLAYRSDVGIIYVSPEIIAQQLGYKVPPIAKMRQKINNALECLDELGHIKNCGDYFLIDMSTIYTTTGYELCDAEIFRRLMGKPELLKHYLIIKRGMINGKCNFSLPYFAKAEDTSVQTISRRNKELEDMRLIIIYQDSYKDGRNNNVYTLYSEEQANKKRSSYSDINRSVSQRYNSFVKNPGKFTPLQKKTLRKEVEQYNERNPDRIKDLSVFY